MTPPSRFLAATSRAARIVAAAVSREDVNDVVRPLREVRDDRHETELLVLALAIRCADLARELYGTDAQHEIDQFAFDALAYERRLTDEGQP